jgi:hypothetical protein
VEDAERLAAYETSNYQPESFPIMYTDGEQPAEELGSTFKFVGNLRYLSEGQFDSGL